MRFCFFACYMLMVLGVELLLAKSDKELFRVMFYNVENLFDCHKDSLKRDDDYLQGGIRGWNFGRYTQKLGNISRVIAAAGEWEPPALIGLCEVENRRTMFDLTTRSPLKGLDYKFIHHESPDARGIDVALLYQPSKFRPIHDEAILVSFHDAPNSHTRDILYVAGIVPTGDTMHVFVCHFPSRLGGELDSESRRVTAARVLRSRVDSLFMLNQYAKLLIMGDFNDYPDNRSMLEVLKALSFEGKAETSSLYNLTFPMHLSGRGSHKHEGVWGALDQIIISGALFENQLFKISLKEVKVFDPPFLLEEDPVHFGFKPFRTYHGMRYQAGFSDHLPVLAGFLY